MSYFVCADKTYISQYLSPRVGETRIGQQLLVPGQLDLASSLEALKQQGARFALLGIPEDIGPRANLGRGGADQGWPAFLSRFCNLQQNAFVRAQEVALLGHVKCDDLQQRSACLDLSKAQDLAQLRNLVSQLDERVAATISEIVRHDLMPIIIGGGHNNAYPILKGISTAKQESLTAINLDPHTDFRALEGRHSGNGFSYASDQGFLSHYFSLGMHELKNSAANIAGLNAQHFPFISYQQIWSRREMSLAQALQIAACYLGDSGKAIGIELDLDSISFMPASAYTNCGVSIDDAEFYVHTIASLANSCYLHLAEGAPIQHPAGKAAGDSDVGQGYAALVACFIQAKQQIGE